MPPPVRGDADAPDPVLDAALDAARTGDRGAIAVLFRDLHPRLLRYLRAQLPGAAEDVASETWLALAPRLGEITGGALGLRRLAFTIARRRVVDERRRRSARPMAGEAAVDEAHLPTAADAADLAADALGARDAVDLVVRHLSPEAAEIVLLRVVAELSAEEVGVLVGKSPGAVRVAQHRALARLAQVLSGEVVTP